MKTDEVNNIFQMLCKFNPNADMRFEGTEYIFSSEKENNEVEWSHKNIKSIEIIFNNQGRGGYTEMVVKL